MALTEAEIAAVLAQHPEYILDEDSTGDLCAGCFESLDPDGDSHAGSMAGLRKHQAAEIYRADVEKCDRIYMKMMKRFRGS